MASAPVRPRAYAAWLEEVTSTNPAPADAPRHALCLFGVATSLFTRWCPAVLAPEFANRQTFDYDASAFERINDDTHLVVLRECLVADVWRDRSRIAAALREVHVVLLFQKNAPTTDTPQAFLAERVGMTATGSCFLCVTPADMLTAKEAAMRGEGVDQPTMKRGVDADADTALVTVEASKWGRDYPNAESSAMDALVRRGVKRATLAAIMLSVKRMRHSDALYSRK